MHDSFECMILINKATNASMQLAHSLSRFCTDQAGGAAVWERRMQSSAFTQVWPLLCPCAVAPAVVELAAGRGVGCAGVRRKRGLVCSGQRPRADILFACRGMGKTCSRRAERPYSNSRIQCRKRWDSHLHPLKHRLQGQGWQTCRGPCRHQSDALPVPMLRSWRWCAGPSSPFLQRFAWCSLRSP